MTRNNPEPSRGERGLDWPEVHRRLDALRQALATGGRPPKDVQARILRERAQLLARVEAPPAPPEPAFDVVIFALGPEQYAVAASHVCEVVALKELTPLPTVPPLVAGIFNLRGQIVSVLDLKRFLGLPLKGMGDFYTVLVMESGAMRLGLLVDRVINTESLATTRLRRPAGGMEAAAETCVQGVTEEGLVVLDAAKLLADSRVLVHEEVA